MNEYHLCIYKDCIDIDNFQRQNWIVHVKLEVYRIKLFDVFDPLVDSFVENRL